MQNSGLEPESHPDNIDVLQVAARVVDPEAIVWRGSAYLPASEQGVVILGTPLGYADFVRVWKRTVIPIGFCWRRQHG